MMCRQGINDVKVISAKLSVSEKTVYNVRADIKYILRKMQGLDDSEDDTPPSTGEVRGNRGSFWRTHHTN